MLDKISQILDLIKVILGYIEIDKYKVNINLYRLYDIELLKYLKYYYSKIKLLYTIKR